MKKSSKETLHISQVVSPQRKHRVLVGNQSNTLRKTTPVNYNNKSKNQKGFERSPNEDHGNLENTAIRNLTKSLKEIQQNRNLK
jgi:hypothetical protein